MFVIVYQEKVFGDLVEPLKPATHRHTANVSQPEQKQPKMLCCTRTLGKPFVDWTLKVFSQLPNSLSLNFWLLSDITSELNKTENLLHTDGCWFNSLLYGVLKNL